MNNMNEKVDLTACTTICMRTCQSDCENTCQTSCEIGCQTACQRNCQTSCEKACQSACQKACQTCQTTCLKACQSDCENTCQTSCEIGCQTTCQLGCQTTCEKACQACQGASCQTCQTTCLKACQADCESTCQTSCEIGCQTTCQLSCQTICLRACQADCEHTCQTSCEIGCQTTCEWNCQTTCELSCQNCQGAGCQTVCQLNNCQTCQDCQTTCMRNCMTDCESTCQESCEIACQNCLGNVCQTACQNCLGDVCQTACQNCLGDVCQTACQCSVQNNQGSPTQPNIDNSSVYRIRLVNTNNMYLNIYGNEDVSNNRAVNIYELVPKAYSERWEFKSIQYNNKSCYLINSNLVNSYSLHNSNSNCDIITTVSNYNNTAIELIPDTNSNEYKILLSGTSLYLTATGTSNSSQVKWLALGSGNQLWEIETIVQTNPLFIEPKFPFTSIINSYTPPIRTGNTVEIQGVFETFNQRNETIVAHDSRLRWACAGFAYANLCSFYANTEIKPWWFIYSANSSAILWVKSLQRVIPVLSYVAPKTFSTQSEYYAAIKSYIDNGQPVIVHCTKPSDPNNYTHYALAYKYEGNCEKAEDIFVKDSIKTGGEDNLTSNYGNGQSTLRYAMNQSIGEDIYEISDLIIFEPF